MLLGMSTEYFAIVGDVVSSKKIEERDAFQSRLQKACDQVNATFADGIYAQIKITKGIDEISGILTKIENAYSITNVIFESIYPNLMRFAIVHGVLDTALESRDATKIDGPAFHKAAELIAQLKKTKNLVKVQIYDELIDRLLNLQINSVFLLKKKWTKRQFEVAILYKNLRNQKEVAKRLGIKQQTVSRIVKSANYDEILESEQSINEILKEYQQRLLKEKT